VLAWLIDNFPERRAKKPERLIMRKLAWLTVSALIVIASAGIWASGILIPPEMPPSADRHTPAGPPPEPPQIGRERATFGAGCFWCIEAMFQQLRGVDSVVSGYSGGWVKNPTYKQVCNGNTGHAEVIQITYDPKLITFVDLLEVFWQTHDPTTPNRQGNDIGTQYRSVVFYHSVEQKELAEQYERKLDASNAFDAPIVTQIAPASAFYPAEGYHQSYFVNNPSQPYCSALIRPKLEKFAKVFKDKLR
jgi:peptide-methionine (S)-S-oxide reductase